MNAIQFGSSQENKHQCQAEREGEWVVFRCPLCPDYERRIHTATGKMTTKSDPNNSFKHSGVFMPLNTVDGLGAN